MPATGDESTINLTTPFSRQNCTVRSAEWVSHDLPECQSSGPSSRVTARPAGLRYACNSCHAAAECPVVCPTPALSSRCTRHLLRHRACGPIEPGGCVPLAASGQRPTRVYFVFFSVNGGIADVNHYCTGGGPRAIAQIGSSCHDNTRACESSCIQTTAHSRWSRNTEQLLSHAVSRRKR